jgi:hypothetical protein
MKPKKIALFDRDPRHVAAQEKLRQLQLKREELEKAKDEILTRPKPTDTIEQEARKLLQSETLELPGAPARDDEELERAYRDIQIVERAIRGQMDSINKLQLELSRQICQEMKPKYAEKVRAIAEAANRLAECAQQERDLRESLVDEGVILSFEAMPFFKVGFKRDEYAYANIYSRQAEQAGYL